MNHNVPTSSSPSTFAAIPTEAVLFQPDSLESLKIFATEPDPLKHIGFTGVAVRPGIAVAGASALEQLAANQFTIHNADETNKSIDLAARVDDMGNLWSVLEALPSVSIGAAPGDHYDPHGALTLLQLSIRPVPIVPVNPELVYGTGMRQQRELLRSLVFWRKRFDITRHVPKLVHAGNEGLLIFIIDSWLVTVNQNAEEASIDLGSQGSMWLMLGTSHEVHLHGSMLILPAGSGAIVANELAR